MTGKKPKNMKKKKIQSRSSVRSFLRNIKGICSTITAKQVDEIAVKAGSSKVKTLAFAEQLSTKEISNDQSLGNVGTIEDLLDLSTYEHCEEDQDEWSEIPDSAMNKDHLPSDAIINIDLTMDKKEIKCLLK